MKKKEGKFLHEEETVTFSISICPFQIVSVGFPEIFNSIPIYYYSLLLVSNPVLCIQEPCCTISIVIRNILVCNAGESLISDKRLGYHLDRKNTGCSQIFPRMREGEKKVKGVEDIPRRNEIGQDRTNHAPALFF